MDIINTDYGIDDFEYKKKFMNYIIIFQNKLKEKKSIKIKKKLKMK